MEILSNNKLRSIAFFSLVTIFIPAKNEASTTKCEPFRPSQWIFTGVGTFAYARTPFGFSNLGDAREVETIRRYDQIQGAINYAEYLQFSYGSSSSNGCWNRQQEIVCRIETGQSYNSFSVDSDGDGLFDELEQRLGLDPNNATDAHRDLDSDGVSNIKEWQSCSKLDSADSDRDGMDDAFEVQYGLQPYNPADANADPDNDGATNRQEFIRNTNPTSPDKAASLSIYTFENQLHNNVLIPEQGENWTVSDKAPYRGAHSYYKAMPLTGEISQLRFFGNTPGGTFSVANMLELDDGRGQFRILLNGTEIYRLAQTSGWQEFSYQVPEGNYTIVFELTSDDIVAYEDAYIQLDDLFLPGVPVVSARSSQSTAMRDFETGQIGSDWTASAENPWDLYATSADTGAISIGSAKIGDDETSRLSYSGEFTQGKIKFDVKTSSEWNKDFLTFYIDGKALESWSGTTPWLSFEIDIEPGVHQLTWEYKKNHFLSSGTDRAWLDNIELPLQSQ